MGILERCDRFQPQVRKLCWREPASIIVELLVSFPTKAGPHFPKNGTGSYSTELSRLLLVSPDTNQTEDLKKAASVICLPVLRTRWVATEVAHQIKQPIYDLFLSVGVFVPLPRALQTFFEVHQWLVAQYLLCQRDICLRIANIPGPGWIILRLNFLSGDLLKHL